MKILWITGWAVPPSWFVAQAQAAWPEAEHQAATPTHAAAALAEGNCDAWGGYSLGALWLLRHAQAFSENIPVALLAPIFSFCAEDGAGGKVARAQLRLQRRRLRKDAPAAVRDFFRRAGLADVLPATDEISDEATQALDAELGWLENWRVTEPPPKNWRGFIGADDPLLDAAALKKNWPALQIIPQANHAPALLLRAARKIF